MSSRAQAALSAVVLVVVATLAAALPTAAHAGAARRADTGTPVARGTATDDFELRTLVEVNTVRAAHGLRPIRRVLPCLDALSESWGARMATEGLWEHRDMGGVVSTCRLTWTGETLARGSFSPKGLVGMWMDSPPHRAILLTPRARLAGIDVSLTAGGQRTAVLNLGDRR